MGEDPGAPPTGDIPGAPPVFGPGGPPGLGPLPGGRTSGCGQGGNLKGGYTLQRQVGGFFVESQSQLASVQ